VLKAHGDWPTVKKKLADPEHDKMMLQLLQYRRRLTDALLSVAWLRMRQDRPRATDTRMDFWETEPVGSVTRTSDLDVTTVGNNCAGAVKYFNDFYRRGFCAESGVVLDSNVYCEIYKVHDWVPNNIAQARDSVDKNPACQDAMALAKLRRYAKTEEWDKFAKSTAHVPTVAEANNFFRYYEDQLRQASIVSTGTQCTAETGIPLEGHAAAENAKLAAANELYARRLESLRELIWDDETADQLKFEQSAANLFANESYNSQGPLLHVLGIVQGKRLDLIESITKEQLLNSVNEQIGDALKDLTHYEKSDADIGEALYKSSKYIYRALEAVSLMRAKDKNIQWAPECQRQPDCRGELGERSLTALETLFGKPGSGYDVETLLSIRAGEYGSENVIRGGALEGITIEREYRTTDARVQGARFHATEIRDYQTLRDRLITAAIDINLRARPPAGTRAPPRCNLPLQ
jgi:hypothetical protein